MKRLRPVRLTATALLSSASLAAFALLAAVLPGCGGVDSGGTGQTVETTSTTSAGRISGFGSVIVNGIRFDDAQAEVVDEDGTPRSRADLALGMLVEVQGDVAGDAGVAERIRFGPAIAGPVASVDVAASRLVVLGQTVLVDADTLYGGVAGGLAGLQPGQAVEVHAFHDVASGTYTATRIDRRTLLAHYTLRGRVDAHVGPPARRFSIGAAVIEYGSARPPVPALANGEVVRVTLETVPVSGRWIAKAVQAADRVVPEREHARLEGYVSGYLSSAQFFLSGVPVDASGPDVRVHRGNLAALANGVRLEVEGRMHGGVLVASRVEFKRGGEQEFELHGTVEAVDVPARTLVVRGVTVHWNPGTRFMAGNVGHLAPGVRVEVRGTPTAGAALLAASIRFER